MYYPPLVTLLSARRRKNIDVPKCFGEFTYGRKQKKKRIDEILNQSVEPPYTIHTV